MLFRINCFLYSTSLFGKTQSTARFFLRCFVKKATKEYSIQILFAILIYNNSFDVDCFFNIELLKKCVAGKQIADVNIKYKCTSIATISASDTNTLQTSGKYCVVV